MSTLQLRLATLKDADVLFRWRNDAVTRQFSLQQDPILPEQHLQWLTSSIQNPQRRLYIAELEQSQVGTLRVDIIEDTSVVSWTVAPEARNKGIAKSMLINLLQNIHGPVKAQILDSNTASIKVAESVGMTLINTDGNILNYGKS